jgi:hypothetical protein
MGMHVMGLPEIVMRRSDIEPDGDAMIDVMRYLCHTDHPIEDGHLVGDEDGPQFRATLTHGDKMDADSPMHNPFGRLKLVSMKDIAESN